MYGNVSFNSSRITTTECSKGEDDAARCKKLRDKSHLCARLLPRLFIQNIVEDFERHRSTVVTIVEHKGKRWWQLVVLLSWCVLLVLCRCFLD